MAGYPKSNRMREALLVGRTTDLFRKGSTPEEIAAKLNQPLESVNSWLEMAEAAGKITRSVNG